MNPELTQVTDDLYFAFFIVDTFGVVLLALALLTHQSPRPSQVKRIILLQASAAVCCFCFYWLLLRKWSSSELAAGIVAFAHSSNISKLMLVVTAALPVAIVISLIYMCVRPIPSPARTD